MASTRLISKTTVKAQSHTSPSQKIPLTPWDLRFLLTGPIQKGLFFRKPKNSDNPSVLIQTLKSSLSRTLDIFYPFAGRLATVQNGDMTSFFINCNNAGGALFVHAVADGVTLDSIINAVYIPSIVGSYFALNGVNNHQDVSKPLLAVQVTELEDGLFIGCTLNHVVADGTSLWHFLNSWSELNREGSVNVSKPPILDRWFLDDAPVEIRTLTDKEMYPDKFILPPWKEKFFHFTKEIIGELQAKANAELGSNEISSLQALLAHLWRSIVRCRNSEPHQETCYGILIGARPRILHPVPISSEYLGNAIQAAAVSSKSKELVENGIGYAAWKLNRLIAEHTKEKLTKFLRDWMENPKLLSLNNMMMNTLMTSSSPRFNVYGNDFGWGKPIGVRSGEGNKREGKITVYPGIEFGSIDIEVCLSPEILLAMENDSEFMRTAASPSV
ncbi:uncharacterized acetyltransferase At3g50280-like isoform X2 [Mercurialis annua]|nr:uncharacterized acetyltransferase At3g50280-like isoform X2 [Mercurialis annua]